MANGMRREFLGWDRPVLVSATDWLFERGDPLSEWDLSRVVVVVPGRRAGRRLLELLVLRAEQTARRLIPPAIETLGVFPERLYPLQRPLASELVQQLTWAQALRAVDRAVLERIVPRPPADEDVNGWWNLAKLLQAQHRELAADGLEFADVATQGADVLGFDESPRWDALKEVQRTYLQTLDGLELWDVQTARLVAVRQREPQSDRDIVLVGTVDLNQVTRQLLDLVAADSTDCRVTALIGAPAEFAHGFDSHGCLLPAFWGDMAMEVPDTDIRVCEGSAEQARQVSRELVELGGQYRADEIVVGLTDVTLGPFVERELFAHGVRTRWIEATRLADSGPSRLLLALADFLESRRYEDFAAFVRHADVNDWFRKQHEAGWDLTALDAAFREHLPLGPRELSTLLQLRQTDNASVKSAQRGLRAIDELLAPWQVADRPIREWAEPLLEWLRTIYADRVVDESTSEFRSWPLALEKLNLAARELASIPDRIAPQMSAAEAIRCVARRLAEEFAPPDFDAEAIELLGWLDLWLDDTPAAIVTTFNEGLVPTSLNSDLFLPNELRRRLGLNDNARRYARDAYAVTVLRHSRRDVRWLVARRDAAGQPLVPSRLLFAMSPEELPERVLRLLKDSAKQETVGTNSLASTAATADSQTLADAPTPARLVELVGAPGLLQPLQELTLNVTEFRTFLACRYRYFLKHVLKLRALDDDAVELDALAFGNVLHEVLRRFGVSSHKDCGNPEQLERVLRKILEEVADELFGSRRRTAVSIQLKQLESRLAAFAICQAKWRDDGWVIEHVELAIRPNDLRRDRTSAPSAAPTLALTDEAQGEAGRVSVWLHGRIDRLDRNERTGEWALLDYKSGDRGDDPKKTHRLRNGEWIDLQLPLYRHLVRELSLATEPKLGYINLPKELKDVGFRMADWSAADLASADETAANVARQIAAREFWPRAKDSPIWLSEFDDLCQVGVFGGR